MVAPGWMAMAKLLGLCLAAGGIQASVVAASTAWLSPPLFQRACRHHTSCSSSCSRSSGSSTDSSGGAVQQHSNGRRGYTRRRHGRKQQQHQQQRSLMALDSTAGAVIGGSSDWLWFAGSSSSSSNTCSSRSNTLILSTSDISGSGRICKVAPALVSRGVQNAWTRSTSLCCVGAGDGLDRYGASYCCKCDVTCIATTPFDAPISSFFKSCILSTELRELVLLR